MSDEPHKEPSDIVALLRELGAPGIDATIYGAAIADAIAWRGAEMAEHEPILNVCYDVIKAMADNNKNLQATLIETSRRSPLPLWR